MRVKSLILNFICPVYFKSNKKIYASFIDLRKAIDSVVHPALLHKLLTYGICGKFYNNVIASMYENTVLQIKMGSATLSDKFLATVGVKQGGNLSPNIFNLYLNDIVDALDNEICDPVKLGSTSFNCLLYANNSNFTNFLHSDWLFIRLYTSIKAMCKNTWFSP